MTKLVVELTDRCNLSCRHCPSGRHGGHGELSLDRFAQVLSEGHEQGITSIAFTGGEPLLHSRFGEIIKAVATAGYQFGVVSNGYALPHKIKHILPYREALYGIIFSLDGAFASSHDQQRGDGSFIRLMQAVSVCVAQDIPFTFNTTVHKYNYSEVEASVQLAQKLSSRGICFGFLVGQDIPGVESLQMSKQQRRDIALEIEQLQARYDFPILMAPGGYTHDLLPCGALRNEEYNLDWQGKLGLCCNLSGLAADSQRPSVVIPDQSGLGIEFEKLTEIRETLLTHKQQHHSGNEWQDEDYWPCQYCEQYFFNHYNQKVVTLDA